MAYKVIDVTIKTKATAVSREGFGLPLVVSTEKDEDYKVYTDASDVESDYGSDSDTVDLVGMLFGQSPRPPRVAVVGKDSTVPSELRDKLNELKDEGNFEWYFLLCTDQSDDVIKELADYAGSNEKFFAASTSNIDILDESDLDNDRTFVLIHNNPDEYPAEGLIGVVAPQDPGSITWAYQQVQGAGVSGLEDTEIEDVLDKNGNVIIKKSGVEFVVEGKTVGGQYADITRSEDFLKARIEEEVLSTLINAGKIPYTETGISQVVSAIESAFEMAYDNGIIAEDEDGEAEFEVNAPSIDDTTETDRSNRVLPNVEAVARLAGAIHKIKLNVTLEV